jgi:hypothetical protein
MRVDWYYRHIFLSVLLGQAYAYVNVNVLISPYSYSHGIIRPYNHKKRAFRFRQTTQQLFLSSSSAASVSACDASKSKSKEAQLLISSEEEETATATIAFAASLVSYQCAEDRLRNALEAFDALKISYDVRGLLEDYVVVGDHDDNDDKTEYKYDNIVDMFLSALASTTVGRTDLQAGFSTCADLLLALHDDNDGNAGTFTVTVTGNNTIHNDNEDALFFKPPTRSLIGTIDGMDVTLLRDKEDVHRRFSMLFSVDRAKGLKIAPGKVPANAIMAKSVTEPVS